MAKQSQVKLTLDQLEDQGFDKSEWYQPQTIGGGLLSARLKVRCSQCEALVINGIPTHETGCRNAKVLVECWECGCEERWLSPGSRFVCDDCANPEVYETDQELDEEDYNDDDDEGEDQEPSEFWVRTDS